MKRMMVVDIGDIFDFAEDKFGKGWNACCALFQGKHEILPFRGRADFCLCDLEAEFKRHSEHKEAKRILIAFMKKHKLKEMCYVGNGN